MSMEKRPEYFVAGIVVALATLIFIGHASGRRTEPQAPSIPAAGPVASSLGEVSSSGAGQGSELPLASSPLSLVTDRSRQAAAVGVLSRLGASVPSSARPSFPLPGPSEFAAQLARVRRRLVSAAETEVSTAFSPRGAVCLEPALLEPAFSRLSCREDLALLQGSLARRAARSLTRP